MTSRKNQTRDGPRIVRKRGRRSSMPTIPNIGRALADLSAANVTTNTDGMAAMTKLKTKPGSALKRAMAALNTAEKDKRMAARKRCHNPYCPKK
jgi:hypothetical protein